MQARLLEKAIDESFARRWRISAALRQSQRQDILWWMWKIWA